MLIPLVPHSNVHTHQLNTISQQGKRPFLSRQSLACLPFLACIAASTAPACPPSPPQPLMHTHLTCPLRHTMPCHTCHAIYSLPLCAILPAHRKCEGRWRSGQTRSPSKLSHHLSLRQRLSLRTTSDRTAKSIHTCSGRARTPMSRRRWDAKEKCPDDKEWIKSCPKRMVSGWPPQRGKERGPEKDSCVMKRCLVRPLG